MSIEKEIYQATRQSTRSNISSVPSKFIMLEFKRGLWYILYCKLRLIKILLLSFEAIANNLFYLKIEVHENFQTIQCLSNYPF